MSSLQWTNQLKFDRSSFYSGWLRHNILKASLTYACLQMQFIKASVTQAKRLVNNHLAATGCKEKN